MKYLVPVLVVLLQQICFAQISNPGFEEWEVVDQELSPVGWRINWTCNSDSLLRIEDSTYEGDYALRLSGWCSFIEGGYRPTEVIQRKNGLANDWFPDTLTFWYKMLNIQEVDGIKKACADLVVTYYINGQFYSWDWWNLETTEEIEDWQKVKFPLLSWDRSKNINLIIFTISGGGCPSDFEYQGNGEFIIDGLQSITSSAHSLRDKSIIRISPNPSSEFIHIENVMNSKLEIYDFVGNLLIKDKIGIENNYKLEISNLKSGLYIARVLDESNSRNNSIMRFIKN